MKKLNRLIPKSKVFYKIYLWNIAATIIFMVLISTISIGSSNGFILDNTKRLNQETVSLRRNIFDDRLRLLDESINMLVEQETILNFMFYGDTKQPSPTELKDIVICLQSMCDNNRMLDSISLVDFEAGQVLSNYAMYPVDESGFEEETLLREGLYLEETADGTEIRYVQYFNPLQRNRDIFIVLTLDSEVFYNNLLSLEGSDVKPYQEYILTEDGKGLSWDGIRIFEPEITDAIYGVEHGNRSIRYDGQDLLIYVEKSELLDWSIVWIQNYTSLRNQSLEVMRTIILSCLCMILLAAILIFICTWFLYKPLGRLGTYVSQRIPGNKIHEDNEYRMIEDALDWLKEENDVISKKYQDTLPILVQNTVYHLITNEYEEERFQHLKAITGKEMEREYYLLLLYECASQEENQEITEKLRVVFQQNYEIEGFWTVLQPVQTAWLLNTSLEYEPLLELLQKKKQSIGISGATWYISRIFKNIQNVNLIYYELEKKREQKFFRGKNTLIYEETPKQEKQEILEKRKIKTSVLRHMKEGNEQGIREELDILKKKFLEDGGEVHYICYQYFELCGSLISSFEEVKAGTYSKTEERELFDTIFSADNIEELNEISTNILTSKMEKYTRQDKGYSENVEKAIVFIQKNYRNDLSLDDIAGAVYLSGGYLSNVFKTETGDTIFEYITKVRMQEAKKLLLENPSMKIKDISEGLGYNTIQSFLRYFKKYYGVTPVEFRKEHGA